MIVAAFLGAILLLLGLRRQSQAPLPLSTPTAATQNLSHLVSLYDNRWDQVRYLNELDQKSVILVVTALTGAIVSADRTINIALTAATTMAVNPIVYFAVLSVIVSGGAIYTTVHNRLSMERAMTAIDRLEIEFNRLGPRPFPYSRGYKPPTTVRSFFWRTMVSIRGPVIVFFMAVVAISAALAGHALAPRLPFPPSTAGVRWISVAVALLPAVVAFTRAGRAACREFKDAI
jgi:hypothetical protein